MSIKIEELQKDFCAKTVIDRIVSTVQASQEFNAKPYIRLLEQQSEDLTKHRRKITQKISEQEEIMNGMSVKRTAALNALNSSFDLVHDAFGGIDEMTRVLSNACVRVSEQLDTIDKQKERAVETRTLLQVYQQFKSNTNDQLKQITSEYNFADPKTILLARRLAALAKDIDIDENAKIARINIERFCENLERVLLDEFDLAMKDVHTQKMQKIATLLYAFNGANSCVQMYISQHPTFTIKSAELTLPITALSKLNRTPNDLPEPNEILTKLCKQIFKTCVNEYETILAVFPHPGSVMQQFCARIYAQTISAVLEQCVDDNCDALTYLRSLCSSHQLVRALTTKLSKSQQFQLESKSILSDTVLRSFGDLFGRFVDGYFDFEEVFLEGQYSLELQAFWVHNSNRNKIIAKKGMKTIITPPMNLAPPPLSPSRDLPTLLYTDTIPRLETVVLLLGWNLESMQRCKEMSSPFDIAYRIAGLWKAFLLIVGKYYVEAGLLIGIEDYPLPSSSSSVPLTPPPIDTTPLIYIQQVYSSIQLLKVHYQRSVMPELISTPNLLKEVAAGKSDWLEGVESMVNVMLKKWLDVILNTINQILQKQPKKDYKLSDHSCSPTQTCQDLTAYLTQIFQSLQEFFESSVQISLLTEFGLELVEVLSDHLKRFSISLGGGFTLLTDLTLYTETITSLSIPLLTQRFATLKQYGTLFITPAESLKQIIFDLAKVTTRPEREVVKDVMAFAGLREDWGRVGKKIARDVTFYTGVKV